MDGVSYNERLKAERATEAAAAEARLASYTDNTRIGRDGQFDPFYQFQPVRSELAQARIDEARSQTIFPDLSPDSAGANPEPAPPPPENRIPLNVVVIPDSNSIRVNAGIFADQIPELDGTPINADPAPVLGSLTSSNVEVWIKIDWDLPTQLATAAEFEVGASVPSNTSTVSYTHVATLVYSGSVLVNVQNFLSGSQTAAICGDAEVIYLGLI
jgi:hypothetical protein